ncbi:hypothetical protein C488_12383 [Natrinema pellirubrum DSM 15624]|uniref:Uncharacterized protein n=1 Tax=Natrinema pellirubrum (strain DSM 15624 / CIP 106293 / JCM 10476 / NCIMB 786 / 157) TaxID=797303 RepID=L9YHM6_NATP1|nr:hypothetical protein C488_12383 [Natrinema pellirubrum DSM 15624]
MILIGAITLAFIILGLVVVVNSVLLTETLSSEDSGRSGSDAATVEYDIEQGIAGIAHRGNLRWGNDTPSDYNEKLRAVVEDGNGFRRQYQNVTGNSRPVIVDISVDGVPEDQQAKAKSDEPIPNGTVNNGSDSKVGHLSLNLQYDGTGDNVTVYRNGTGSESIEITGASLPDGDGFNITDEDGEICTVRNERAEIDLVTGAVNATVDGSCDRQFIDPDVPTSPRIEGDTNMGTYDIVTRADLSDGSDAAWAVDVTVTYDSSDVSYERPYRVFLYGDRS